MKGLLLLNLGTPDAPSISAVRRYLKEFLMDPCVMDIAPFLRWILVHGIILPTRPAKSAAAYAKVWTKRGPPLLFHSQDITKKVKTVVGHDWIVVLGMRYGNPSIRQALELLRKMGCKELVVCPLYPQYSLATTQSAVDKTQAELKAMTWTPKLAFVPPFYSDCGFVEAFAEVIRGPLESFKPDFVLFSFHGLPERQVRKTDPSSTHCLVGADCCNRIVEHNRNCYRAQSFATARLISEKLGLPASRRAVAFQSRFGITPWIQPSSEFLYDKLAQRGVKRLLVACPSFVADCLETLEEVGIRGREAFRKSGGKELVLAPSLNSNDLWAKTIAFLSEKCSLENRI